MALVSIVRLWSSAFAEIPHDHRIEMSLIEIPGNRNHRLPRIIVCLYIIQQLLTSQPSDRLFSTQDRAAERMASQHLTRVKLLYEILRVIPNHTNFFQDDLFFFFDFFGCE